MVHNSMKVGDLVKHISEDRGIGVVAGFAEEEGQFALFTYAEVIWSKDDATCDWVKHLEVVSDAE